MKPIYTLITVLLLGCTANTAEPSSDRVVCEGKFIEMSDYQIVINCNDGRTAVFNSGRFGHNKSVTK